MSSTTSRLRPGRLLAAETGKLLVRDNAIILSIEHVRLIITADKVLVPREGYEHNPLRCALALGASGRRRHGLGPALQGLAEPSRGCGPPAATWSHAPAAVRPCTPCHHGGRCGALLRARPAALLHSARLIVPRPHTPAATGLWMCWRRASQTGCGSAACRRSRLTLACTAAAAKRTQTLRTTTPAVRGCGTGPWAAQMHSVSSMAGQEGLRAGWMACFLPCCLTRLPTVAAPAGGLLRQQVSAT